MFTNARDDLDAPPFALPRPLDRLAERWWRARPRTRFLLGASLPILALLAGIAHTASSPHGPPARAWVATRDLVVGEPLGSDVLERVSWPAGLLPDGVLTEPQGALVAPLPRGAVATEHHLGDGGLAAGLPAGSSVVPIPAEAVPVLGVGATVDVIASDPGAGPGRVVATDATVLRADETAVWLAVDRDHATDLASAVLDGSLGVVLTAP